MLKKFIFILAFLVLVFLPSATKATDDKVNVYFFYGDGCPHCHEEKNFLEFLENHYQSIDVHYYEVWHNPGAADLLRQIGGELNIRTGSVPITIINGQVIYGYLNAETTGKKIEQLIDNCLIRNCSDPVASIMERKESDLKKLDVSSDTFATPSPQTADALPQKFELPLFGEIDLKSVSLPALTLMFAFLDGFNPCAMWVLLFLITMLLGMQNRARMWTLGVVFIAASGIIYFLFMSAWLNLFLFIGLIFWVRLIIGIVALSSGGFHLKEFFTNKTGGCKASGGERRQKTFQKLKQIATQNNFWLALGGIILLAFAVNLVELICSAGLPAVYTQILSLTDLTKWQYYLYLIFYVVIFMLDDLFVFFAAMITLQITGISTKYCRWINLIGGIIMLIIGLLLIFKPEYLMFG